MHGQWTVPLVLLLVPGIRSEAYPETARICTYEDSHGNTPNEMNCRETLAGGLQCRDLSKCREEGMGCSDSDVLPVRPCVCRLRQPNLKCCLGPRPGLSGRGSARAPRRAVCRLRGPGVAPVCAF